MLFVELYKIILSQFNLVGITYIMDVTLCSLAYVCLLLDALLMFVIISVIIKVFTKRSIFYWINKIIGV